MKQIDKTASHISGITTLSIYDDVKSNRQPDNLFSVLNFIYTKKVQQICFTKYKIFLYKTSTKFEQVLEQN